MKLKEFQPLLPGQKVLYALGRDSARGIPALFKKLGLDSRRVIVVSNRDVWRLHGAPLANALEKAGCDAVRIEIPEGEKHKTLEQAAALYKKFLDAKATRSTPVIALGGGVITDLAAFAASTYMRGLPLALVPTTLLAQADAAVGGKTGVNLPGGKNLVGTFYHPKLVIIDPAYLKTLSGRDFRNGLSEIIKMTILESEKKFGGIEKLAARGGLAKRDKIDPFLLDAVRGKLEIVERDPTEKRERMLLNLGHTFAHALESATGYTSYTHGEAVAIGLAGACRLAERLLRFDAGGTKRVEAVLKRAGLPARYRGAGPKRIFAAMASDKKKGNSLRFILPRKIGDVIIEENVPESAVIEVLEELHED